MTLTAYYLCFYSEFSQGPCQHVMTKRKYNEKDLKMFLKRKICREAIIFYTEIPKKNLYIIRKREYKKIARYEIHIQKTGHLYTTKCNF